MSKIIPVMVHHETGEKAQAAGKKNQEYLKYCIAQAKKYNEKVVLLGDEYNKAWCDDWHNANDFITENGQNFMLSLRIFPHIRPHGQRASLSAFS